MGNGFVQYQKRKYLSFEKARFFARSLKLKSSKEWFDYWDLNKPDGIPKLAYVKYKKNGWISWGDWLGTGYVSPQKRKYLSFANARKITRDLKIKSKLEWFEYIKSNDLNIPRNADKIYKDKGWVSWADFFGYRNKKVRTFLNFRDAKKYLWSKKISNRKEWIELKNSGKLPDNIPSNPRNIYKNDPEWKSLPDFVGYDKGFEGLNSFLPFNEAREIVWTLNLKSWAEWNKYCSSTERNRKIPKSPQFAYSDDWLSIQDWLGYKKGFRGYNYLPFDKARSYVRELKLNSQKEWIEFRKSEKKPDNIPSVPQSVYKKEWNGMGDWLGTGRTVKKNFTSFIKARSFARTLKLKSTKEWYLYSKSGKRPENIPSNPQNNYKNDWKGWPDFLGNI